MGNKTKPSEVPVPGVKPVQDVLDQIEDLRTAVQMFDTAFSDWEKTFINDAVDRVSKFGVGTKFSLKQENRVQEIHEKIPS